MSGPYKIYIFDTSCNLFLSSDTGTTWSTIATPTASQSDDWSDMLMAVNDGDQDTVVAIDHAVNNSYNPILFNGNGSGIEPASIAMANLPTSPILSFDCNGPTNWLKRQ